MKVTLLAVLACTAAFALACLGLAAVAGLTVGKLIDTLLRMAFEQ